MIFLRNYYVNVTDQTDIRVLTEDAKRAVRESNVSTGVVLVLIPGCTAGVTLLEGDPSIYEDYKQWIEGQIPVQTGQRPSRRSGTGRNYAHLRAALVGSQVSIPLQQGKLMLGPWQEIVLFDFDDKIGRREITIQIFGEGGKK